MSSATFFCEEYHTSAGSVLFRFDTQTPQICILQNKRSSEYVLPKGHKDLGESLEQAALRETYEETGFHCAFYPVNLLTRVPPPGIQLSDGAREAKGAKEAIAITIRNLDEDSRKDLKFIWWYITQITSPVRNENTQMATEDLEAYFMDVEEAIQTLSRHSDRDVAKRAWELVKQTLAVTAEETTQTQAEQ